MNSVQKCFSHEHIGSKISAKIIIYTFTRGRLLCRVCYETPCSIFTRFSQGSILKSLVKKKSELAKLFNFCWNWLPKYSIKRTWFQQMLNNFVNSKNFITKLSTRDLSQAEKKLNVDTSCVNAQYDIYFTQNDQSCHFVSLSACNNSHFLLSLR